MRLGNSIGFYVTDPSGSHMKAVWCHMTCQMFLGGDSYRLLRVWKRNQPKWPLLWKVGDDMSCGQRYGGYRTWAAHLLCDDEIMMMKMVTSAFHCTGSNDILWYDSSLFNLWHKFKPSSEPAVAASCSIAQCFDVSDNSMCYCGILLHMELQLVSAFKVSYVLVIWCSWTSGPDVPQWLVHVVDATTSG